VFGVEERRYTPWKRVHGVDVVAAEMLGGESSGGIVPLSDSWSVSDTTTACCYNFDEITGT